MSNRDVLGNDFELIVDGKPRETVEWLGRVWYWKREVYANRHVYTNGRMSLDIEPKYYLRHGVRTVELILEDTATQEASIWGEGSTLAEAFRSLEENLRGLAKLLDG
jgi:hypothetical protein